MPYPLYIPPSTLPPRVGEAPYWVCPHCKREMTVFLVFHAGVTKETYRCRAHGDGPPMKSAVVNREFIL